MIKPLCYKWFYAKFDFLERNDFLLFRAVICKNFKMYIENFKVHFIY